MQLSTESNVTVYLQSNNSATVYRSDSLDLPLEACDILIGVSLEWFCWLVRIAKSIVVSFAVNAVCYAFAITWKHSMCRNQDVSYRLIIHFYCKLWLKRNLIFCPSRILCGRLDHIVYSLSNWNYLVCPGSWFSPAFQDTMNSNCYMGSNYHSFSVFLEFRWSTTNDSGVKVAIGWFYCSLSMREVV